MEPEPQSSTKDSRRTHRSIAPVLGVVGEVCVTLGVLLGLFVVWELWWTDLVGTRHQQEIVDNLAWQVPATPEGGFPVLLSTDDLDDLGFRVIAEEDKHRTTPPPEEDVPGEAETFATIYVPRWGSDYVRPISEGVGRREVLDKLGIGHYAGTALPGGWGNFAVAGHRTTFGKPFNRIEELVEGDAIIIRTESTWYVYRVTDTAIVRPGYSAAIAPVPGEPEAAPNGRYVTLTTCHPMFSAKERYVVYGVLDYWADASAGYPGEIVLDAGEAETTSGIDVGEGL